MMKKLLCTFLIAVIAIVSAQAQVTVSGGSPLVVINSGNTPSTADNTDFGNVPVGSIQQHTFTITNNSGETQFIVLENLSPNEVDFSQSEETTPEDIEDGQTATFTVTFQPQTVGVKTTTVNLGFSGSSDTTFQFNIRGNGQAPPPEPIIEVYGNNTFSSLIPDGASTASATESNGRDYGLVTVGSTRTRTFRITNKSTATADLVVSEIKLNGSDFILQSLTYPITITPGNNFDFQVTHTPTAAAGDAALVRIYHNDVTPSTLSPYNFRIKGQGQAALPDVPEINVLDNSNANLASGGSVDFGTQNVPSGSQTFTFTIQNLNTQTLPINLTDPSPYVVISGANASDFTLGTVPSSTIAASGSTTFTISFDPSDIGIRTATVSIANNDSDENPYTFTVTGEGIDASAGSPLLITQYYENGNEDYIEIKNISSGFVPQQFYLCLFTSDLDVPSISISSPVSSIQIPGLNAGEVAVFRNSSSSGSGTPTAACNFDGNDVILISTTNNNTAYNNRRDIVGVVGSSSGPSWGANISYIKGCGTNESPSLNFAYDSGTNTVTDYIELSTSEVDAANGSGTNLELGVQTIGATTWTSSWNNGIPDKTKNAIVNGTYNAGNGSFESCDLTINGVGVINFTGTTNYIKVNNDLAINGSFTLGDQAALVTVNPTASISGVITKQESTTTLKQYDYTFWSSPVTGASTSVFTDTGAPASRIFQWRTPQTNDPGGWELKSGTLERGRGYISEGPDGATVHNVAFTGVPNNGEIRVTIGFDNQVPGYGGYNLIGNPYPCAIDIESFITYSSNDEIRNGSSLTDGSVMFWTHNTEYQDNEGEDNDYTVNDYVTYNIVGGVGQPGPVSKNIGSSQGFYVKAKQSGTIYFENSMKLDGQNTQFFRSTDKKKSTQEKDRMWLDVKSEKGGAFSQILIGFFKKATDGEDWGYDATKFSSGNYVSLYSNINDKKYAIQGLGSYNSNKEVSIGFDSRIKEEFSIAINRLEGVLNNEEIYLVDNYLNKVHDLKASDYKFEITETGSFSDRFTLKFNKSVLSSGSENLVNNFVVVNENDELRIKAGTNVTAIKVYDMLGRLLINDTPNKSDFSINSSIVSDGSVLIVNATLDNGAQVSKKVIKY